MLPILLLATSLHAAPPLTVMCSPREGQIGGTLKVAIDIAPNDHNRILAVAVDNGSTFFRSWEEQLVLPGGDPAPAHREQRFTSVPDGQYTVMAALFRLSEPDKKTGKPKVEVFRQDVQCCFSGPNTSCVAE